MHPIFLFHQKDLKSTQRQKPIFHHPLANIFLAPSGPVFSCCETQNYPKKLCAMDCKFSDNLLTLLFFYNNKRIRANVI